MAEGYLNSTAYWTDTEKVDSSELALCRADDSMFNPPGWEVIFLMLNITSIIINSLHLVIISQIRSLTGTAYLRLLQFLAAADIFEGFMSSIRVSNVFRNVLRINRPLSACVTTLGSVLTLRYHFMMSAIVERAIAVCRPLQHRNHLFIRKLPVWLTCQTFFIISTSALMDVLYYKDICINTYYGPNDMNKPCPQGVMFSLRIIPSVVIIIGITKILYELQKTSGLSITNRQRERVAATKTIMILCVMIMFCLIPALVGILLRTNMAVKHSITSPMSLLGFFVYGIANTVVYGWRNKKYRRIVAEAVRKAFSCPS